MACGKTKCLVVRTQGWQARQDKATITNDNDFSTTRTMRTALATARRLTASHAPTHAPIATTAQGKARQGRRQGKARQAGKRHKAQARQGAHTVRTGLGKYVVGVI